MSKKNIVLFLILLILIALAYVYQGPFQNWQQERNSNENFLAKLDINKISKIIISNKNQTVALKKEGVLASDDKIPNWRVSNSNFYVSNYTAKNIYRTLNSLSDSKLELVSENKNRKKDFKTDESGLGVKIYQGDYLAANFIVGRPGIQYPSCYISRANEDSSYLVNKDLFTLFSQDEWRDKTIFSSDKERISKIRFQYPDQEFIVEKLKGGEKEKKWQGVSPYKFKVDTSKIEKVLDLMSNLEAAEIPKQNFKGTGLEKHLIIVEANGEGVDNTIMVGFKAPEKDLYYAKKAKSDNIYLITKEQREILNKTISSFK